MVKIIEKITEFDYYNQDLKVGTSKIKALIKAPEPIGWISRIYCSYAYK